MARKRTNIDEKAAEVPLSSMIDVVFLLLIYFILTQKPVIEDVHLQVDLPAPGAPSTGDAPQLLTIDVMKLPGMDNDELVAEKAAKALLLFSSTNRYVPSQEVGSEVTFT